MIFFQGESYLTFCKLQFQKSLDLENCLWMRGVQHICHIAHLLRPRNCKCCFFKIFLFFTNSKEVRIAIKTLKKYLGWHKPQIDSSSAALTTVALPSAKFSPIWPIFKATRSERLLQNVSWPGRKDNVWASCHFKRKYSLVISLNITHFPSASARAPTCSPERVLLPSPSTLRHAAHTWNNALWQHLSI